MASVRWLLALPWWIRKLHPVRDSGHVRLQRWRPKLVIFVHPRWPHRPAVLESVRLNQLAGYAP